MKAFLPFLVLFFSTLSLALAVDAPDPAIAKLRDTLKNTMLQLRTVEGEKATLQAVQAELEAKNKELTDKIASITKQLAADKTSADKAISTLRDTNDAQKKEGVMLRESLEKWKQGYNKAADVAKNKEGQRAKLADEVIRLDRLVLDRETKNLELYQLAKEILTRYENFGLGRALLSREPFTGVTKIKLETLVQDYADKIQDAKIKPSLETAKAAKPAAEAPAKAKP